MPVVVIKGALADLSIPPHLKHKLDRQKFDAEIEWRGSEEVEGREKVAWKLA